MVLGKRFFTAIMLTVLLFGGLVKAQKDFISNQNDFGSYVGNQGAQNVLINNTFNQPLLFAPGTENLIQDSTKSNANFIGGALNEITTSGENALDAYNLLYGNNNSLNNSTSTGLIGHVNSSEYVTASAALGRGNTLSGNTNLIPGEDDLPQLFAIGTDNLIDEGNENVAIGTDNLIDEGNENVAIGSNNSIELSSLNSFALAENTTIIGGENCGVIGQSHRIENNSNNAYSLGAFTGQRDKDRSLVLGFGASPNIGDRLLSVGDRSITIGTNSQGGEVFNTLNIRPPSSNGDFVAPLVGIGTPGPDAKLNIVNRGATGSESVALRVERFIEDNDNEPLFNVRNDGAAGFNLPAKASPRAPYQFEPSNLRPFKDNEGNPLPGGEANIVQNYRQFPFFESTGPNTNASAKWLALGERPPASGTNQVAYGLANAWDDYAANFTLLKNFNDTSEKDATITFQDVGPNGDLKTDAGRNRLRFLFRNSLKIEKDKQKINTPNSDDAAFEAMSVYPEGNVTVGDYSNSAVNPNATFEIRSEQSSSGTAMEVFTSPSNGNKGTSSFTIKGNGNVGIGTNSPSEKLVVDGQIFPASGQGGQYDIGSSSRTWNTIWLSTNQINGSDKRLKSNIDSLTYGMKEIMQLNPVSYKLKDRENGDTHLGLIAQQLEEVIQEPVETGEGEKQLKGVRYPSLIPVLINGMQEQQKQVNKQKKQIKELQANLQEEKAEKEALKEKVNQLNQKVKKLAEQVNGVSESFKKADENSLDQKTATLSNEDADQAMLLQNRPNPYSNETVIPYYLPENAQNANMLITNSQGQMLKRIPLKGNGRGELTLQTTDLNKGQYQYTLIIDGRQIQTRKMIVK